MSISFLPVNVDWSPLNTGDKKTGRAVGELQPFLSRGPVRAIQTGRNKGQYTPNLARNAVKTETKNNKLPVWLPVN